MIDHKIDLEGHKRALSREGATIVKQVLTKDEVGALTRELENAIAEDLEKYSNVFDKGMVHNCMVRGQQLAALLDNKLLNFYIKKLFSETCILYAYQSSSLPPQEGNYGTRIHVDSPRFIPGYQTNIGVIFPLTDFRIDNGATKYLPSSHLRETAPDEELFDRHHKQLICRSGDMIIFSGRLYHSAGINESHEYRHSITLNICRSYMRQRFDFPRLVPKELIDKMGEDAKRLIGMNVRMPVSLEQFYVPEEERMYKSNQG